MGCPRRRDVDLAERVGDGLLVVHPLAGAPAGIEGRVPESVAELGLRRLHPFGVSAIDGGSGRGGDDRTDQRRGSLVRTETGEQEDEVAQRRPAADGAENARALQRAIRNTMTEHAGVVRDEEGLAAGLAELDRIEQRMSDIGVHPDIAGYQDLAHAFDLKASALAARATLESARERRETRGSHNRSDHPDLDPALEVNLVWSPHTGVVPEPIPPVPTEIADLIHDVSTTGKLVE